MFDPESDRHPGDAKGDGRDAIEYLMDEHPVGFVVVCVAVILGMVVVGAATRW